MTGDRLRELADKRSQGSLPIAEWGPACANCGGEEYRIDGYCSLECRDWCEDYMAADAFRLLADAIDALEPLAVCQIGGDMEGDPECCAGCHARALVARFRALGDHT